MESKKKRLIFLIRHGETAWNLSGQHTSTTDLDLTTQGKLQAAALSPFLQRFPIDYVWTSPLKRAQETCRLAQLKVPVEVVEELREWNYGAYEGLTHEQILKKDPQWSIFEKGGPQGETPKQVILRAQTILAHIEKTKGNIALFSHGHFLRAFMTQWIGKPITFGENFLLSTASISILGHERDVRAVAAWNLNPKLLCT